MQRMLQLSKDHTILLLKLDMKEHNAPTVWEVMLYLHSVIFVDKSRTVEELIPIFSKTRMWTPQAA